ncbi:MAG: sensor histidine kinase [Anaerovoracaceae bacterium]
MEKVNKLMKKSFSGFTIRTKIAVWSGIMTSAIMAIFLPILYFFIENSFVRVGKGPGHGKNNIVEGIEVNAINDFLEFLKIILPAVGVIFVIIAVLGSLFIAGKALKPIANITETVSNIHGEDLSERIKGIDTKDEVGVLANTFNNMFDDLEESFKRERRFAADASHELRTPVAVIMNNSELLIESAGEKIPEEYFAINEESKRMNKIISQLLALSRGYEGQYKLDIEELQLGDILENVIAECKEKAEEKGLKIIYKRIDQRILADQMLITQLFMNLIENAIKYTGAGQIEIFQNNEIMQNNDIDKMAFEIIEKKVDGKQFIQVIISDTGIGISAEDLPHIFDRFYRADKSRDRSGVGLGLSISKWITEVHGGSISVTSQENEGSQFIVSLAIN